MGEEVLEVYLATDQVEVQVAVGILEDAEIPSEVRDLTARAYPLSVGLLGELRIIVAPDAAELAMEVLQAGVEDGALSGRVLWPAG
jgi:hypothetical protein